MEAVIDGRLADLDLRWNRKASVCVVMGSRGYPDAYESGKVITGIPAANAVPDTVVFHAGTRAVEHLAVSAGGRVLGVTSMGETIAQARDRAYAAVEKVHFDNACFRTDIAANA